MTDSDGNNIYFEFDGSSYSFKQVNDGVVINSGNVNKSTMRAFKRSLVKIFVKAVIGKFEEITVGELIGGAIDIACTGTGGIATFSCISLGASVVSDVADLAEPLLKAEEKEEIKQSTYVIGKLGSVTNCVPPNKGKCIVGLAKELGTDLGLVALDSYTIGDILKENGSQNFGTLMSPRVNFEAENDLNEVIQIANTLNNKTCKEYSPNCPSCSSNQDLKYYSDGSGYCEDKSQESSTNLTKGNFYRDDSLEIVIDTKNNLMWQDNLANEGYNWQKAIDSCSNLIFAEYSDWKLPNINELHSIMTTYYENNDNNYNEWYNENEDLKNGNSFLDLAFENPRSYLWSSDEYINDSSKGLLINFVRGSTSKDSKINRYSGFKCVRNNKN